MGLNTQYWRNGSKIDNRLLRTQRRSRTGQERKVPRSARDDTAFVSPSVCSPTLLVLHVHAREASRSSRASRGIGGKPAGAALSDNAREDVFLDERRLWLNSRLFNGGVDPHEVHEPHNESPRTLLHQRFRPILMRRAFFIRPGKLSPPPPLRPGPCVRC
jgi:hypothetical protein